MRVLVACEFSGIVRDAFVTAGHDAWSCDLLPTERPGPHLIADARLVLYYPDRVLGGRPRWMRNVEWDLLIAHPPCTYLANSGVRWLYGGKGTEIDPDRWAAMENAGRFFAALLNAPVPRIAVENPIMHRYGRVVITDDIRTNQVMIQTVQPWMFGHGETKATQFWLRNLPIAASVGSLWAGMVEP